MTSPNLCGHRIPSSPRATTLFVSNRIGRPATLAQVFCVSSTCENEPFIVGDCQCMEFGCESKCLVDNVTRNLADRFGIVLALNNFKISSYTVEPFEHARSEIGSVGR